jgi:phosphatidylinositol N-acetylglucosaminyltransferase subunit H
MILSGRVDRHFVPIGKILKPLLNECVTPVTCYWSLALLLRDEEELKLVFQVKITCYASIT